jgi:hypothetical protein
VAWAFLCDYAIVDAGGKVSIIGIFDRLFTQNFPAVHPILYLVAAWTGPPGGVLAVELRVWSPSQDLLVGAQQQIGFGPDGRSTGIFLLSPIPLPSPGDYLFELMAGETSVKHLRLGVGAPPQQ